MLEGTEENYTSKLETPNSDWTWFQSTNILRVFFLIYLFFNVFLSHIKIYYFFIFLNSF
jgi:hypothetical protein